MKIKPILPIKIAIDLAMTVLFLLLVGYHLLSDLPHEWIGVSLFVLFLVHNILNWRWYKNLFKGKYSTVRTTQTIVNFLLWIAMIGCVISAVCISGHVFSFLGVSTTRFGRALHLSATMWAFVLMSVHLGFHWQMILGMVKKAIKPADKTAVVFKWVFRVLLLAVCVFGCCVFAVRKIWEELFVLTEFKWFDYEKNVVGYFFESASIMILFASVGYYLKSILIKKDMKRKE